MRPTFIEISRQALLDNVAFFRRIATAQTLIAIVKANAYGHGIETVAPILAPVVDMFGVAYAEEGAFLREIGVDTPILVLMTPTVGDIEAIIEHNLEVVGCSLDFVHALSSAAQRHHRRIPVHVYVDTGMHRDGVPHQDVLAFVEECSRLDGIELKGICTHFARSDDRDCTMTTEQNHRFSSVLAQLESRGYRFPLVHAANTAAAIRFPETHYTALRIGIGLYGTAPGVLKAPDLRPVLRLRSQVTALRRVEKGESVGYGTYYFAPRTTTIATIAIGYGDGYSRMLSGKAECLIGGKRYPIVGAICMDECMVDVGDDPIRVGDEVVLIGSQGHESITISELADRMGTIPYEVTTLLSNRIPRVEVE
ncbi:MAG: alanine racemase [Bacteroidota bacterium]|nr:alanine racemase [Bacteroidota bacterium]